MDSRNQNDEDGVEPWVKDFLTEKKRRDIFQRLRRAVKKHQDETAREDAVRKKSAHKGVGQKNLWSPFGLRLRWGLIGTCALLFAAGLFLIAPTATLNADRQFRNDLSLPDNLKINFWSKTIHLYGGAPDLSGSLSLTNSPAGLTTFGARFQGRDKNGLEGRFEGILVLTNVPGVLKAKSSGDVTGALLYGDFIFPGPATNKIFLRYLP